MTAPADIIRRVDHLEAGASTNETGAIVVYLAGETEAEMQARVPPGAANVLFIPDNGRRSLTGPVQGAIDPF